MILSSNGGPPRPGKFEIWMPSRFIRHNVGGNTTYARTLMDRFTDHGYPVRLFNSGRGAVQHILFETAAGLRRRHKSIVHFVADTGPEVRVRTPSVVTVQGVASRWIKTARTPAQEALWRHRVGRAIASTDRVITGTQSSADDISSVFDVDPRSIVVIPHGIESEVFAKPRELSPQVAAQVPESFVLYLGNIEPRKNIEALVSAFDIEPLSSTGLPLVVAGKPAWNFESAMKAIEGSSRVIYLGFVSPDDRAALLQKCTIFAFPSLYEGFGFPPLEAMAAGAPVAISRRGSLAEVGGPAFSIDDVSPEGISIALAAALADSAWMEGAAEAGRRWVRQFDWAVSAERHLDTYAEVMHEYGTHPAFVQP